MYGVVAGGPGAVAWGYVHATGPRIWTTADGRDWEPARVQMPADGTPEYPGEVLALAAGEAGFVAVGSYVPEGRGSVALVWASSDGRTWRLVRDRSPFRGAWVTEVVAWDGGFLAYGHEDISWDEPGPPRTWASGDGVNWTAVAIALPEGAERVGRIVAAGDRLWGLASYPPARAGGPTRLLRVRSRDGLAWRRSPLPRVGRIEALHPVGDRLYLTVTKAQGPDARSTLGVHRSTDSVTWTPLAVGRPLGSEIIVARRTLVMVGSRGGCTTADDRCVAAAWRSTDGGVTWAPKPVTGTPRWASRAWMTQAAALPDGTLVAVGTELEGWEPSTAAWVSLPGGG